ncbi:MAG TPA: NAD-dependent epimerase/dehydratase family protein [Candidatus Limnocylindrales bacterium]|nr:NAD-dependent epimerase/dehydratase family protein [Candidatus Limnocylindrales bacterium]
MSRRVLVTGITGFAGSHLAERLLAEGDEVHGLAHEPPPHPHLAAITGELRMRSGDVADGDAVRAALLAVRPDVVFHLAGVAVPTQAAADPRAAVRVNVEGAAAVAAAVRALPGTRLVAASSADVYGSPPALPVGEATPARPGNVYAATKVAAEAILLAGGAGTVVLRPANQNGPRQHPGLAASAFAKQIAEAEAGLREPVLRHGRTDQARDFVDVRDMAGAYVLASRLPLAPPAVFNVGSGVAVAIAEILRILVSLARIPMRAEADPSRMRPGGPSALALDARRFREATGWSARIPLERSLSDTLAYWRERVSAASEEASPEARDRARGA